MMRSNAFRHVSEPVREFTARRAAELAGAALIAASVAAALALVSWSARDPSFNHATTGRVRNLLGSGGAVAADILMQMLGLAAIAAILPLAAQGLRLVTQRALHRPLLRFGLWIIGALAASAVVSLLPVTDRWPLPTGLGGVLGDAVLALPRRVFGELAAAMALVALVGAGTAILGPHRRRRLRLRGARRRRASRGRAGRAQNTTRKRMTSRASPSSRSARSSTRV